MTQKQRLLEYLRTGRVLTRFNSWEELGIMEAPARICELRREGYPISTRRHTIVNRFGEHVSVAEWSMPRVG